MTVEHAVVIGLAAALIAALEYAPRRAHAKADERQRKLAAAESLAKETVKQQSRVDQAQKAERDRLATIRAELGEAHGMDVVTAFEAGLELGDARAREAIYADLAETRGAC